MQGKARPGVTLDRMDSKKRRGKKSETYERAERRKLRQPAIGRQQRGEGERREQRGERRVGRGICWDLVSSPLAQARCDPSGEKRT
jgi:hypothetical protein